MLKKLCMTSSELTSRNNAGETITPASVAGNKFGKLSDKLGFILKKLPLSADKVGLSKKLTLSDQIIWVSLR